MIPELKNALTIESVFGYGYGKMRCPFPDHEDHTPSFSIYRDKSGYDRFRCFGSCGRFGDVIDLAQELYSLSKKDAIDYLAKMAGVTPGRPDPVKMTFREWERSFSKDLSLILRTVREKLVEDSLKDVWDRAAIIGELDYLEYIYGALCGKDDRLKFELFKGEING
jgi:DNA primase